MFEMFFPTRKEAPDLPEPTPVLALGALLVRVAFADREYRVEEVAAIDRILATSFNIGPLEAAKLRATCEALERDAPGTDEFTELLHEKVLYGERKTFAGAMWQVLLADGDHNPLEERVLHQIEAALGITAEDSAALKAQAIGSARSSD